MSETRHVFKFGAGEEQVVATDVQDAIAVANEFYGPPYGEHPEDDLPPDEWTCLPDDEPVTIDYSQVDGPTEADMPPGATLSADGMEVTAPAAAWASMGRRWLSSTEW